ncbi:lipopolysaccharide biosynthesis protein [Bifidobacterium callimiconis]|uniref:lipopolysaccharide biosynthesis protein n=1 Tax=Bifidobacterium callimiconis TaxID=2306973 RepID=UPI001BDD3F02|nr:lipopolysaccharide biosynthesis protein [Bifidobacterium callimiconis]MBT1177308.1 lipopolysaccharide biosynthesis protein [Bifidobacterium callimiconis]
MVNQRKAGAIFGYANIIVRNLVSFVYLPMMLHFVSQADYGVFQMTNSIVVMLGLLNMGFSGAYIRFYAIRKARNDEDGIRRLNGMYLLVFMTLTLICVLIGIVMWLNTELFFKKGLTPDQIALTKDLTLVLMANMALNFPTAIFVSYISAHERFVYEQTRQLFAQLAAPLLSLLLLVLGFKVMGVAIAQLAVTVLLMVLNVRYAMGPLKMRFSFHNMEFDLFKQVWMFSFWLFLNQIFDLVNNNVPNYLLGAFVSAEAVAVYAVAMQIRNIFFSLSTTMSNVFIPKVNAMVAGGATKDELLNIMIKVGRYQMLIFCLFYGGFVAVGREFIALWAGKGFEDAYLLTIIMTLPVAIPLTQNVGIEIQRAMNLHKARSLFYVFTSVINIIVTVAFASKIGYWSAAWGYVISIVLGPGIFMNWYNHKKVGLNMVTFWRRNAPIIGVCCIAVVLCQGAHYLIPLTGLLAFIVYGILYVAIFCGGVYPLLNNAERNNLVRIVRRH